MRSRVKIEILSFYLVLKFTFVKLHEIPFDMEYLHITNRMIDQSPNGMYMVRTKR